MASSTASPDGNATAHVANEDDSSHAFQDDKIETTHIEDIPYSLFSPLQKLLIAYAASISATFSGLSSFIYYPAITALARSLQTSTEAINLTITAYLITSGVAPSIIGDLADRMGRRPITLLALTLYLAANVGLALQNKYSALMVLRCIQSAGSSGTIALAYGVISDISTPADRGSYVAILMVSDIFYIMRTPSDRSSAGFHECGTLPGPCLGRSADGGTIVALDLLASWNTWWSAPFRDLSVLTGNFACNRR